MIVSKIYPACKAAVNIAGYIWLQESTVNGDFFQGGGKTV
jgi:hypothetical protein